MQLRISNGSQAPFNGSIPQNVRRHKQRAIFTYHNKESAPRNVYYDANPYFLHISPSEPRFKPFISSSRNSSRSREHTDTASQRSCKVVRANGLKIAQKPNIARITEQSPVNSSRMNEQTRRFMQREMQLEAQNKVLKGENEYLKEKVRTLQEDKAREIQALHEKIERLQQVTAGLERKMQDAQLQWKEQIRKLRDSQLSDF